MEASDENELVWHKTSKASNISLRSDLNARVGFVAYLPVTADPRSNSRRTQEIDSGQSWAYGGFLLYYLSIRRRNMVVVVEEGY